MALSVTTLVPPPPMMQLLNLQLLSLLALLDCNASSEEVDIENNDLSQVRNEIFAYFGEKPLKSSSVVEG
ncbi:hypothetical protein PBY51_015958 [Eleginops maclovinus]|uniref:Uncharacterized protein n=1 Tax=Eleginops maclovinus TaxID=56733 RepID=A0AAN7XMC3_ELEMC|nr:hypothetical protein PBY51_015958 [Eleginops maclovinus]